MSLRIFWNKLKYWQKGAIIGLVFSLAFVFFSFVSVFLFSAIFKFAGPVFFVETFLFMFGIYIIPATIAGSIIGWIIGKFIKK